MLINGVAPFINGRPIYKWVPHLSADKWCSTVYKRCKFINGAQHIIIVKCTWILRDCWHFTMMWNFKSSGIGAAPIPDDKKIDYMVTNVTVHTWQQKSDLTTQNFHVVIVRCERSFCQKYWA